ncbi:MAG: hypothetical protein A2177_16250 [Spirochaetes bacterium RBG_13_68_11]|nr:MAG: hypothetical protein A2177_16250 [Spirochaetes bacterium RBG_13_68_11]
MEEWSVGRTRFVRILLACTAAVVLAGGCTFVEKIEQLAIDDIDLTAVRDGEYTGTVRILPVTAKVRVAVKDGAITGIDLVRHFHGPDHGAEQILGRVIEAQSLRVDAVSGSTYSSKVVLKAIESALQKGR